MAAGGNSGPKDPTRSNDLLWALAPGAAYGISATLVGQPLDTIKTMMQTENLHGVRRASVAETLRRIGTVEGTTGLLGRLYGGGRPMLLGAMMFRSVPFVVYEGSYAAMDTLSSAQLLGTDWRVWVSGMISGVSRALLAPQLQIPLGWEENPCEALKTQKQVWGTSYKDALLAGQIWRGFSATCWRNMILVTTFFVLLEKLNRTNLPALGSLKHWPFLQGSCITVCCWLIAWPLDVVKSQMQSRSLPSQPKVNLGNTSQRAGLAELLIDTWKSQRFYRGLMPGLLRSCLANGSGMYAYQKVQQMR